MRHIFGPVRSRRFGLSLGIDLSPRIKQCNFDCLYCELEGKKAIGAMSEIADTNTILNELKSTLPLHKNLDVITVTANGEPTLYPYLHELITGINSLKTGIKTLILSNGSRFGESNVQEALCQFDIVKFSLDAVSERAFRRVDRADKAIRIDKLIAGIKNFAIKYNGMLVAEILFVKGVNDNEAEASAIAKVLREIAPARVDISTIDRPPAYKVDGISPAKITELAQFFNGLQLFIARRDRDEVTAQSFNENGLIEMIKKRPLSDDDVELLLDEKSRKILNTMIEQKVLERILVGNVGFFRQKREN
ncbi:MAG: radical SAM protein [Wolinella sp.]